MLGISVRNPPGTFFLDSGCNSFNLFKITGLAQLKTKCMTFLPNGMCTCLLLEPFITSDLNDTLNHAQI
jgi:hypothetical protein